MTSEGKPPPPPAPPVPPLTLPAHHVQPKWFNTQRETFEPVKVHFAINDAEIDAVKELVEKGANLNFMIYGNTPLTLALLKEHYDIAHVLIDGDADVSIPEQTGRTKWKRQPIHLAAADGRLDLVSKIHSHGGQLDTQDAAGMTPLIWAATNGRTDTAIWLAENGSDVNIMDNVGRSALFRAVEGSHMEIVRALHKTGGNIEQQDDFGWTPLFHALVCNDFDMVRELLSLGASVKHENSVGQTVLHLIANRLANDNLLTMCRTDTNFYIRDRQVSCGASKHAVNNPGYELPIAELLLNYGANPNVTDARTMTPLYVAATEGNADLVNIFVRAGADVFREEWVGANAWPAKLLPCIETCHWLRLQWEGGIHPLDELCRALIRHTLDRDINDKVKQLPLPTKLLQFLSL